MRINPFDDDSSSQPINSKKHSKVSKNKSKKEFSYFLEDEEEKDINIIIKEIIESGNSFSRSPSEENMNTYKKHIRTFLGIIKNYLYTFSDVENFEEKRVRFYFIVDRINEELEALSKKLLDSERSTIYFASKITEINGLIMDLYR
uniref:DUF327 family protein n=1 Tax=Mesoaciditoga lauensis TaxID=1495039 RepID=A0A7V3VTI6_9BACT